MDQAVDDLRTQLEDFATTVQAVPEVDEPPKTTLEVLDRRPRETYWISWLQYLLDPSQPHGFNTTILDVVLKLVTKGSEDAELEYQSPDDIVVKSEVGGSHGNRLDLLVALLEEWAVCCELKVTSGERDGQTRDYYRDSDLPPSDLSVPPDSEYYVYISKADQPDASAEAFQDVSWQELVNAFGDVLLSIQGDATERGMAQLRDFRDTITREVSMTEQEYSERQREKMELYLKYHDEIQQARDAFEDIHDREKERWTERFLEEYRPDTWSDEWNCEHSKRGLIYRDDWRLDANRTPVDDRDAAVYRLEFQHFLRKRSTFTDGRLRVRVYTSRHGVPNTYREAIKELTNNEYYDELADIRQQYGIEHVAGKKVHAEKYYSFDPTGGPDVAYETLAQAFEEFIELAPILTEIHEQALDRAMNQ